MGSKATFTHTRSSSDQASPLAKRWVALCERSLAVTKGGREISRRERALFGGSNLKPSGVRCRPLVIRTTPRLHRTGPMRFPAPRIAERLSSPTTEPDLPDRVLGCRDQRVELLSLRDNQWLRRAARWFHGSSRVRAQNLLLDSPPKDCCQHAIDMPCCSWRQLCGEGLVDHMLDLDGSERGNFRSADVRKDVLDRQFLVSIQRANPNLVLLVSDPASVQLPEGRLRWEWIRRARLHQYDRLVRFLLCCLLRGEAGPRPLTSFVRVS